MYSAEPRISLVTDEENSHVALMLVGLDSPAQGPERASGSAGGAPDLSGPALGP